MSDPVRVFLVDDHRMFAEALEALLNGEPGIQMAGWAASAEEALEQFGDACPEIVLMDVDLPGMDGVAATMSLKATCPETHVVIITAFQDSSVIARALEAGASAYLPKTRAADEVMDVIKAVAAGDAAVVGTGNLAAVLEKLEEGKRHRIDAERRAGMLTSREVEVLRNVAEGKSTGEIAAHLYISPLTVQTHVKNILSKLGARSKVEAVTFALRHGVIHLKKENGERVV